MTANAGTPVTLAPDRAALPATRPPVLPRTLATALRLAALVGQATQLRQGAFDPGPLQYWLLAIPVHIDPQAGVVWGAALEESLLSTPSHVVQGWTASIVSWRER